VAEPVGDHAGIPAQDDTGDYRYAAGDAQRLGGTDNPTNVGLGLTASRRLTEAMHGTLASEETPGGGLTMVISVPAAGRGSHADPSGLRRRSAPGIPIARWPRLTVG
jgi:K+-sensing histidine kinase KdpD